MTISAVERHQLYFGKGNKAFTCKGRAARGFLTVVVLSLLPRERVLGKRHHPATCRAYNTALTALILAAWHNWVCFFPLLSVSEEFTEACGLEPAHTADEHE